MENNKFQIHKFERLKKMKIVSVDDKLYIGQDMYTTNSGFQYDKLKGIMYQVWNDPETGEVKKDKMYDDERDLCL